MNLRNTWKRTGALASALLLAAALLTLAACQNEQAAPAPSEGSQPSQGQDQNQGGSTANPPAASVELAEIAYSDADKESIRSTAKFANITAIYVPQKGLPDDKLNQVQGTGNEMTLKFNKMSVIESAQEIKPAGQAESEKDVKLTGGTAKWITAGGRSVLYLKQGDTFIAIQPAQDVPAAAIEAVAQSLAPLQ